MSIKQSAHKDNKEPKTQKPKPAVEPKPGETTALPPVNSLSQLPDHSTARPHRQAAVLHLQQTHGNTITQRVIHPQTGQPESESSPGEEPAAEELIPESGLRHVATGASSPPDTPDAPNGVVQRQVTVNAAATPSIQRAPFDVGSASEDQKIAQIPEQLRLMGVGGGPGADAAQVLYQIWDSFGDRIAEIASAHPDAWESTSKKMDLGNLPAVLRLKQKFRADVEAIALGYLQENRAYVLEEMEMIGATGDSSQKPTADQEQSLREMQELAKEVARAQQAQKALLNVNVGFEFEETGDEHKSFARELTPVTFNPNARPMYDIFGDKRPAATWEETKTQYDDVTQAIAAVTSVYPTLFALVQDGKVSEVAEDPALARKQMTDALVGLQKKIDEAVPKIGNGVDFADMVPIHSDLLNGKMPGASGIHWNETFPKWVGTSAVGDADLSRFLASLGVGVLSAAMFALANMATGGAATIFFVAAGIAASAGQAAYDWKKWSDLSTAAAASPKPSTQIVTQGQVDMALFTAILDTVFVFLDVKAGMATSAEKALAQEAVKAAEAGAKAAVIEGLKDGTKSGVERGLRELGAAETIAKSGKSADDLIKIVGEGSDSAKMLEPFTKAKEAATKALLEDMPKKLPNLAAEMKAGLTKADADQLVSLAIDQYGPAGAIRKAGGWKSLSDALGEGTAAGQRLNAWRDAIKEDTFNYIKNELKGDVVRTGTEGGFKNDMDISLLGKRAGRNREPARRYMASRAGCTPAELRSMMHGDIFIDPTRMLLHATESGLTPEVRARLSSLARDYQEKLMNGRRLHEAMQSGNEEMVAALKESFAERGFADVKPIAPLSEGEISKLSQGIDQEMELLEQASDMAEKERLIKSISEKEATIKASEDGAYATSGAIWKWVFERPGDKGKFGKKALMEMWPDERYTAILAELPSLDHSAMALKTPKDAAEIGAAVRDIGKHGDRLVQVLGESAVTKMDGFEEIAKQLDELAQWCKTKKAEVDKGLFAEAMQIPGEADALVRNVNERLAQLEGASNKGLELLRKRQNLGAVSVNADNINLMVKAHVRYLMIRDAVNFKTVGLVEAVHAIVRSAEELAKKKGDGAQPAGNPPAP